MPSSSFSGSGLLPHHPVPQSPRRNRRFLSGFIKDSRDFKALGTIAFPGEVGFPTCPSQREQLTNLRRRNSFLSIRVSDRKAACVYKNREYVCPPFSISLHGLHGCRFLRKLDRACLIRLKDQADDAAWFEFTEIYQHVIYRLARRKGLQHADAEDLVSSRCFVARERWAIDRWEADPNRARFRTWLTRVATNAIINALTRGSPRAGERRFGSAKRAGCSTIGGRRRVRLCPHGASPGSLSLGCPPDSSGISGRDLGRLLADGSRRPRYRRRRARASKVARLGVCGP